MERAKKIEPGATAPAYKLRRSSDSRDFWEGHDFTAGGKTQRVHHVRAPVLDANLGAAAREGAVSRLDLLAL